MFYYVKLAGQSRFEQVDEHLFTNRRYAVNRDGTPRYDETWVTVNGDGSLTTSLVNVGVAALFYIARLANVDRRYAGEIEKLAPTGSGVVTTPDYVKIVKGKRSYVHEVQVVQDDLRAAA